MPTMTFSFVCHTAVLPIYAELGGGEGQEKGTWILIFKFHSNCEKLPSTFECKNL